MARVVDVDSAQRAAFLSFSVRFYCSTYSFAHSEVAKEQSMWHPPFREVHAI